MAFQKLGLSAQIIRAITEKGYKTPTPIQIQAIPLILSGCDLIAESQTGTGKTASFTLPLLENIMKIRGKKNINPLALILTPTRELASQVEESVRIYGQHTSLKSAVVFGGVNIKAQIHKLKWGIDILVATPGRLLDLVGQKAVDLSQVKTLILDEADRMLDMGFIHDIHRVLKFLPENRQNLLFSATFSSEIKKLAQKIMRSPKSIQIEKKKSSAGAIAQTIHPVDTKRKKELLSHLIRTNSWEQVLVFTRTKHGANRLSMQLSEDGITSAAIHGNKSQNARTKALKDFKEGNIRVLVATSIAARGLDIEQLPYVVNFELPNVPEDYVHRIGRTGRAGNVGQAVSLVSIDDHEFLLEIEKLLKKKITKVVVPNYEPDPKIQPSPVQKQRGSKVFQGKRRRRG